MKRVWQTDELLQHWGLSPEERDLALTDKTDAVAVGFALLLKWFQYEGDAAQSLSRAIHGCIQSLQFSGSLFVARFEGQQIFETCSVFPP